METLHAIPRLRDTVRNWREQGESVALVPTMGNLHNGHLVLVGEAQKLATKVVVSIFINPMQFNDKSDFADYPRTLEDDRQKLDVNGVDVLFVPEQAALYPMAVPMAHLGLDSATRVEVPGLSDILCGEFRPGHFTGVTTIVAKLLNIIQPDIALFGEKDFQQLLLIMRMVHDLHLPVKIVGVPTVREADGLAMSSRNTYLSADERVRANKLYQILCHANEQITRNSHGTCDFRAIEHKSMALLDNEGLRPEYFSVRRASDLALAGPEDQDLVILAAVWLGKTRLIDNVRIG